MLVFIRPEHVHGFHVSSRNRFTLTNIALRTAVVEDFQSRFNRLLYPIKAWETGQEPALFRMNALMQKRFDQLVDDLAWGDRSDLDAFFFLCGLFRLINGRSTQLAGTGIPDWLQNALLHMEQPENLQAGAPRLVELCGRTPEHVSRSFQRYLKQTPSTWVNGLRIRLARQLLETTDLSITQVGYECGYETLSYFHRCFKNAVGATPLAHRNLANRSLGMG
jgi:AraC family transcriptional regulator, dual regulator of chb operon